jgi:hypothetical protein
LSVILVIVAGFARYASATSFQFVDDQFVDSDWMTTKIVDTTSGQSATGTSSQSLTGGQPGAYRQSTHVWSTVPTGVGIGFAHLRMGPIYDPALSGQIDNLSYGFEARVDFAQHVGAVGFQFLIEQNGQYFLGPYGYAVAGQGWQPFNESGLAAGDFLDPSGLSSPDFSVNGAPIRFGYYSQNGGSGGYYSLSAGFGIDNWSVMIESTVVSEAASLGAVKSYYR